MKWTWEKAAKFCNKTYGSYVDWEERMFICPECDEPILEEDWEDEDLSVCPVCEYSYWEDM